MGKKDSGRRQNSKKSWGAYFCNKLIFYAEALFSTLKRDTLDSSQWISELAIVSEELKVDIKRSGHLKSI